ncbi:tetratricopeptide repeat protein 12 [Drosophila mauritiana]|uniref:Tetratricopeptide repeat protein 12 n=1 Tax=Drosophila mauritiana TaxID=7226 RepID=A0A6P8K7W3_DROMA|nr:tetratricopeptide repeat protein 12 [Drosophila mauritiana]
MPANTLDKKDEHEKPFGLELPKPELFIYQHPAADESFLNDQPTKVEDVIEYLDVLENANKTESSKKRQKSLVTMDDIKCIVTRRSAASSTTLRRGKAKRVLINTNQFTFMRQIDSEPDDRVLAREQREDVAETFRRMGNREYRKLNFSLAKDYYSKGIQYIKDSPVLYVNRALCFIKLREFKLGIIDCDYVLAKIDEQYLRAWLYRAAAYKRLNDEPNFEYSIDRARRFNRSEADFIDEFLDKMRSLL